MLNIIVCYKWVLDEQEIRVNAGSMTLDTGRAAYKISDYDRNAVEEAVLLAERYGASVCGLTYGGDPVKQSLKDALSRGLDSVYWVHDPSAATADAFVTANILAAAIRKIGKYDLILCGEGASDTYAQQVAPRLAALVDIPGLTFVSKLAVEDNKAVATRKLGDCTEVCTVPFPAVVSVLPEINQPRIPSLKQVLGAAKKPMIEWRASDLELSSAEITPKVRVASLKGYAMSRKNMIFKEEAAASVTKLVASLAKEGVL